MTSVLQKILSLAESEASSDSKKALKRRRDIDDDILQSSLGKIIPLCRDGKYLRTRWREGYCRDLAEKENSFIAEYRLDPVSFDSLSEITEPDLGVNEAMANLSSKSGPNLVSNNFLPSIIFCKIHGINTSNQPISNLVPNSGGSVINQFL